MPPRVYKIVGDDTRKPKAGRPGGGALRAKVKKATPPGQVRRTQVGKQPKETPPGQGRLIRKSPVTTGPKLPPRSIMPVHPIAPPTQGYPIEPTPPRPIRTAPPPPVAAKPGVRRGPVPKPVSPPVRRGRVTKA